MQKSFPTLFLSHGAPDILLSDGPSAKMFRGLATRLRPPRGIAIISAHWIDDPVGVTGPGELSTIQDFGGFPDALYAQGYPAHGTTELSEVVGQVLDTAGIQWLERRDRGLDHGAWIPLKMIYPSADIPVTQISLPAGSLQDCARFGEALAPLAEQEVPVIGSGGSVHNLRALARQGPPAHWATGFEDWLRDAIEGNDFERVIAPADFTETFRIAHPSTEHYAPLIVAWAAGGRDRPGRRFADGFTYGNVGMSCYAFGAAPDLSGVGQASAPEGAISRP